MIRKKIPPTNQRGFTLPELIIVMLVISILSLTTANFIVDWLQQSSLAQARTSLLLSSQNAVTNIDNDIELSGSVDTSNRWPDPNGPGGNQFGWSSGTQVLILAKIATDSTGNVIFSDQAKYITQKDDIIYFLSGTTLYRRVLKSTSSNDAAKTTCPQSDATVACPADQVIAKNVSSLSIVYYDANNNAVTPDNARSVQVSITIAEPLNNQRISASYSSRMVFRND